MFSQLLVADQLREFLAQAGAAFADQARGEVIGTSGTAVEIGGLNRLLAVGDRIELQGRDKGGVVAEIVGFDRTSARAMPLGPLSGIGPGTRVTLGIGGPAAGLAVSDGWLGRVVDPLGMPLDGGGALPPGRGRPVRAPPPAAATRSRLGPRIDTGIRAMDLFTPCREGQRLGLFAGSGVGKSTLLSMLAAGAGCDVVVLALIGERGREVREFLEDDLGPALSRAVVVVATSDQPALMRREAAYAATAIAEHFRDAGRSVLLMMDSVTRFCFALREIGLAAGEPPATKGYPPSVFGELPGLLERAGPGCGTGSITALYTVLVEGDDHNEPVADAVRGILDGHVVLDRRIAEAGRYPAMDVLRSLSRTASTSLDAEQGALMRRARSILARHAELVDLVRLGAFQRGADAAADEALALAPRIEALIQQHKGEDEGRSAAESAFEGLRSILAEPNHA